VVTYLLIGWRHYDVIGWRHKTTSGPVLLVSLYYCQLPPTTEEVNAIVRDVCLSVCLSVNKITQKRVHVFGWNVACRQMSGHGRTDQLLSAIRIIVQMPEPDCFLRYRMHCNAEFYYVGKIPLTCIGHGYSAPVAAAMRGFEASKHRCRR